MAEGWRLVWACLIFVRSYLWRKILSCGEISDFSTWKISLHDRCVEKSDIALYLTCMWCGECLYITHNLCFSVAIYICLSKIKFCHNLCCFFSAICFVAVYANLCGEKFNLKSCLWRKNEKYQVWVWDDIVWQLGQVRLGRQYLINSSMLLDPRKSSDGPTWDKFTGVWGVPLSQVPTCWWYQKSEIFMNKINA